MSYVSREHLSLANLDFPISRSIYLLTPSRQPRQLRSFNSNLLFVPSVKTNVGTRAFSIAAPTLWNSLPVNVKSVGNITTFCCKIKTHLFKLAYPP